MSSTRSHLMLLEQIQLVQNKAEGREVNYVRMDVVSLALTVTCVAMADNEWTTNFALCALPTRPCYHVALSAQPHWEVSVT